MFCSLVFRTVEMVIGFVTARGTEECDSVTVLDVLVVVEEIFELFDLVVVVVVMVVVIIFVSDNGGECEGDEEDDVADVDCSDGDTF